MTTIAVLGTGLMGAPMAKVLAAAGFDVRVWNRTATKAEPLAKAGAAVCHTAAEAASGASVIVTMLADAQAIETVMTQADGGALSAAAPDAIWLQTSTVGIDGTERLARLAADAGVTYVDSPVLGTVAPAEKGELVMLTAGADQVREQITPVLDALGHRTIWLEDVGAGSRLKLVANSWVLAVTTAVAEAMALATSLGLNPQLFLDAIKGGPLDLPYAQLKGGMIVDGEFPPSFPLSTAAKDAGLIVEAAEQAGVRLRLATAVREQMRRARDGGHGDEDMAAVWHAAKPAG